MPLITLVYVSYETHHLTKDELVAILNEARENNKKMDVTGMLLYRDGFFIQALEGEQAVVEELYERIAADPRHKNVINVYQNVISKRVFGEWSMGFNLLDDADLQMLDGYQGQIDPEFFIENPGRATRLLQHFHDRTFF